MRHIQMVILLIGAVLFGVGCSAKEVSKEASSGRYVEKSVELPTEGTIYADLIQEGTIFRLTDIYGQDLISVDGGKTFENTDDTPTAYTDMLQHSITAMAESASGDRIFTDYIDANNRTHYVVTADGATVELAGLVSELIAPIYGNDGAFYVRQENQIYRVEASTGKVQFLFESPEYPCYMAAGEGILYVAGNSGIQIYDVEQGTPVKADAQLNAFLTKELSGLSVSEQPFLLCPFAGKLYVLTRDGLYCHTLYGEDMEQLIDGKLCGISDISRSFVGMAVVTGEDTTDFLIYYSDGALMHYTYDPDMPAVPEKVLRIYSVYEDGNVRQAVSAFGQEHPEIYVNYEVGISGDYGVTLDDVLKSLSTELAAGNGPDILLMDDIPYASYIEKGVLQDLSDIRGEMSAAEYFVNVIDGFAEEDGLYTMPLTFALPVLGGKTEWIAGRELIDLADLADAMEEARAENEQSAFGILMGFRSAEEELRLLSQSSMGAWMTEENTLDREAVEAFLTQAKRIYDAQMENASEEFWTDRWIFTDWGTGENVLIRKFASQGIRTMTYFVSWSYPDQPFYAGYLTLVEPEFVLFTEQRKAVNGEYVMLPGQQYGKCLATTLLSINSSAENMEEARLFLEYVLSDSFQSEAYLNGIPTNINAYYRMWNPKDEVKKQRVNAGRQYSVEVGPYPALETRSLYWPTAQDFRYFTEMVDSVTGVNRCDSRVYDAVIELGQGALTGEITVEEAVNAIEKRVQLYLAE